MSNTTTITPYVTITLAPQPEAAVTDENIPATPVEVTGMTSPEPETIQTRALRRFKDKQRRERLGQQSPQGNSFTKPKPLARLNSNRPAVTALLQIASPEHLVQVAQSLGYQPRRPLRPRTPGPLPLRQPAPRPQPLTIGSEPLRLVRPSGESLFIRRQANSSRVTVESSGSESLHEVVRAHTASLAVSHFKRQGLEVQTQTTRSGELEILASESQPQPDGQAKITAWIDANGSVKLDVDQLHGQRCHRIARDFHQVVGGVVTSHLDKSAGFQVSLPAQTTKPKVKV